jgi:aspartyl/glutamyl-tRNA(Asn/Gln) amidotransferase C subunit
MPISLEEVRHVARLARIELEEVEVLALQGELNSLLGHFATLQAVDTSLIEPQSHAISLQNVWSEDAIGPTLPRDLALRNSALTKAGLFVVPTIIEE